MAPIEWVSVNWDSTCKHILLLLITSFECPWFWNDLLSVDLSQGELHIDCVIQLVYARFLQCKSVISPFICDYYLRERHRFYLHTIWSRSMQRIWVVGANRDREKQIQIAPLIYICGKSLKWRSKPLFGTMTLHGPARLWFFWFLKLGSSAFPQFGLCAPLRSPWAWVRFLGNIASTKNSCVQLPILEGGQNWPDLKQRGLSLPLLYMGQSLGEGLPRDRKCLGEIFPTGKDNSKTAQLETITANTPTR